MSTSTKTPLEYRNEGKAAMITAHQAYLEAGEQALANQVADACNNLFNTPVTTREVDTSALIPEALAMRKKEGHHALASAYEAYVSGGFDDKAEIVADLGIGLLGEEGWSLLLHPKKEED